MRYRVVNNFGSAIVDGEQAHSVWGQWPRERRSSTPEGVLLVWDVTEGTDQKLMTTAYIPIPEGEA